MQMLNAIIRKNIAIIILTILAVITNIYNFHFAAGITISLSSIFLIIITKKYGLKKALIITIITQIISSIAMGQLDIEIFNILEIVFIGLVLRKKPKYNLIFIDIAYWFFVILGFTIVVFILKENDKNILYVYFNIFRQISNSVINAEVADIISTFSINVLLQRYKVNKRYKVSFKSVIFHLLVMIVIVPFIINLGITTYKQYSAKLKSTESLAISIESNINNIMKYWDDARVKKFRLRSAIEVGEIKQILESNNKGNFFNYYIMDNNGRLILSNKGEAEFDYEIHSVRNVTENLKEVIVGSNNLFAGGYIVYEDKINNDNFNLIIKVPLFEIQNNIVIDIWIQLLFLLILVLITAIIAVLINRYIGTAINDLIENTTDLVDNINNNKQMICKESNIEEVDILLNNFNTMAHKLQDSFNEIERSKIKLKDLAYRDVLTGLPNRLAFQNYLAQAIEMCNISEEKIGVLFMDVNNFKTINDTLGHDAGDDLLKILAERLKLVQSKNIMVFRQGGDEIVSIIHASSKSDVEKCTNLINDVFNEKFNIKNSDYTVTGSIGVSIYPDNSQDKDVLLRYADIAMYKAKGKKVGKPEFYSNEKGWL